MVQCSSSNKSFSLSVGLIRSLRAFRRPDPFGTGRLLVVLHCVQCSRPAQQDEMLQLRLRKQPQCCYLLFKIVTRQFRRNASNVPTMFIGICNGPPHMAFFFNNCNNSNRSGLARVRDRTRPGRRNAFKICFQN